MTRVAVRQGSAVLLDQGLLTLANFVTGAALARTASPSDYGQYVLGWSLLLIFQAVQSGFANVPYTVFAPRLDAAQRSSYHGSLLVFTLAFGGLTVVLLALGLPLFNSVKDGSRSFPGIAIPVLAACFIAVTVRDLNRSVLLAQLRVMDSLRVSLLSSAAQIFGVLLLFWSDWLTVETAFGIVALTNAFAAIRMLTTKGTSWRIERSSLLSDLHRGLNIAKWNAAGTAMYMIGAQLYPWLILALLGSPEVAAFGVCSSVANLPGVLLRGISGYLLPRMSQSVKGSDHKTLQRLLLGSVRVLLLAYVPWVIIGAVFGESLTVSFYSNKYAGYSNLLLWLLVRCAAESIATPFTTALQALEKVNHVAISGAIGAVVTMLLGPIAVSRMGLNGAGLAALASTLAMITYRWAAFRRAGARASAINVAR
jgi:O-antigen/teichoic acid export membrane protein